MQEQVLINKKGFTPDEDFERMAQNLWSNYGSTISDASSFNKAYNEYFQTKLVPKRGKPDLKKRIWNELLFLHPNKFKDEEVEKIFKESKGRDFERDKKHLSKKIVVSPKRYIELGAQNVDLVGYDTPKGYVYLGKQKNKITGRDRTVYARVIHTKEGLKFVNKNGKKVRVNYKK